MAQASNQESSSCFTSNYKSKCDSYSYFHLQETEQTELHTGTNRFLASSKCRITKFYPNKRYAIQMCFGYLALTQFFRVATNMKIWDMNCILPGKIVVLS